MNTPLITKDLVLVGGGHAHIQVMRRFGMKRLPGTRITVISRELHTPYSGMLPGLIAGHYSYDQAHIDLGPLAHFAGARLLHDEVIGLDMDTQKILCKSRPPINFDVLSIDVGSMPYAAVKGASDNAIPVKPVSNFHRRWERLRDRVLTSTGTFTIGVVGGGAGGVELIMAIRHRLRDDLGQNSNESKRLRFSLITASNDILPTHNARVRARYRNVLERSGINLVVACTVIEVTPGTLRTQTGENITFDELLWVTQASAPHWLREAGLKTDNEGFICVEATLQSSSHPNVFAAGDVASVAGHPRPKSGVFAVRQGRPLAENLRRALLGATPRPYRPQRQFLSLISTGERRAIASRGHWALEGRWVWAWKDWIDRRFVRRFTQLPQMFPENPTLNNNTDDEKLTAMRCGGCGSKIGATMLREVLDELSPHDSKTVLIGLRRPDDAAIVALPPNTVSVQTVDAFRSFIEDPWVFGKIAASHSLSDIFAMGATPQSALAIATLPLAKESKMRQDLVQMMSGALEILQAEKTTLVGGHTSEGAELSLGFALNGFVETERALRKTGASVGDSLIITKPLGTGTLFAGAMQGRARSRWIESALDMMIQTNGTAAYCLRRYGATAMTDVTGFGLVGHLLEMLGEEQLRAEFELDRLPILDGAAELMGAGVSSSLQNQNQRASEQIASNDDTCQHPHYKLSFDPQTSGGLLAAIPSDQSSACVEELRQNGCPQATVIGQFIENDTGKRIIVRK